MFAARIPFLPPNWTYVFLFVLSLGAMTKIWGQNTLGGQTDWLVLETGDKVQSQGKTIKSTDRLSQLQGLKFTSPEAYTLVYSATGGRRLVPETYRRPAPEAYDNMPKLATRSPQPAYRMLVDTLQTLLKGGRFVVLGPEAELDLYFEHDLLRGLLEATSFWIVIPAGKDSVLHRLHFNDGLERASWTWQLPIQRAILFPNPPPTSKINPLHRGGSAGILLELPTGQRQWIDVFEPTFIDNEEPLHKEVAAILARCKQDRLSTNQQLERVSAHIQQQYGTPIESNLKLWLHSQFSLSFD